MQPKLSRIIKYECIAVNNGLLAYFHYLTLGLLPACPAQGSQRLSLFISDCASSGGPRVSANFGNDLSYRYSIRELDAEEFFDASVSDVGVCVDEAGGWRYDC